MLAGSEDVTTGQMHTLHIRFMNKVKITSKEPLLQADKDEILKHCDQTRLSQQAVCLLCRDGQAKCGYVVNGSITGYWKIARTIPQKNKFNEEKIKKTFDKFIQEVGKSLKGKCNSSKIKNIILMGQSDLVEQAYPIISEAVKPITVSK